MTDDEAEERTTSQFVVIQTVCAILAAAAILVGLCLL